MADGSGYSAGNLEFQMQAMEKNTTATFSKLNSALMTMMNLVGQNISSLKSLQKTLTSISRIQFNSLDRLAQGLNKLNAINLQGLYNKINSLSRILTPLGNLGSSFTGFASFNSFVNSLNKMSKIDIGSFNQQINSLTQTLKPLLEQLAIATPSLEAFATAMSTVKGGRAINFSQFAGGSNSSGGSSGLGAFKISDLLNKIYFIRNYTKQTLRSVIDIVKNAVEYTETLNLWQVAMRGNTQEAEEFIKTMNKGYGVATQTLMQYQAIFRNMLSSLGGLTSDASYALSEYLTQMAFDYASLYNVSIQKAMTTFQSVLSGQVRPIRSIAGYDITETTIYQLYQQLGGTKTMRQLSQTEKRLLRIYAVFQQMESSGAVGDLSKTMESTANQMRVFSEASKELGTWLGIILENYLKPILPVLNAVTITLTNIVKAIAQMRGIKPQEFGVVESVAELNEELDETQGKLLSFDKFEALNSGAGEDNALGIDENLLAGLSKYESIVGSLGEETQKLVDQWSKFWFNGGDYTKGFTKEGEETLDILTKIGSAVAVLIGFSLTRRLVNLLIPLKSISNLMKLAFGSWKSFGIVTLITMLEYLYVTNEDFRKSLNTLVVSVLNPLGNLLNTISPILTNLLNIVVKFVTPILDIVSGIINSLDELDLLDDALLLVAGAMAAIKYQKIIEWFTNLSSSVVNLITNLDKATFSLSSVKKAIGGISGAIAIYYSYDLISNWNEMSQVAKTLRLVIIGLTTAIWAMTIAQMSLASALTLGVGVATIVAAIGLGKSFIDSVKADVSAYKTGGQVEDGIFTMNKGEVMGTFDDGTSIVANNQQIISGIQQGVYSAVVSAMRQTGGNGGVGDVYLDGRKVGQTTSKYSHQENVRIGLVRATR